MKLQAAKIRLTVNELSEYNIPKATPAKELAELCGYSDNFSLNQIPTATLSISLGGRIQNTTLVQESSVKDWSKFLQERTPVCVVLEVQSDSGINGLLTTTAKMDSATRNDKNSQGLIRAQSGKFCLFKGYVTGINTSYGTKQGTFEISLQHWLSDLALIPILNPVSSPENPSSIAVETVFRASNNPTNNNTTRDVNGEAMWALAARAGHTIFNGEKDIFDAIKGLFQEAISQDYGISPNIVGSINQALYDRVNKALAAITGEELALNYQFDTGQRIVRSAIGKALQSEVHDSYYSVTIWDKLITKLLPSFRMALVPMVDRAVVVPAPGIFMPDKDKPDITPDHTTQLNVSLAKTGILAGMSLVCASTISVNGANTAPAGHVTQYRYPITTKPGVFKVCQLPSWLMNCMDGDNHGFAQKGAPANVFADPLYAYGRLTKVVKDRLQKIQQRYTTFDRICQSFVKTTYFSEVTRQNSALLIANMDLRRVPGIVLKVQLPSSNPASESEEYIQGVITSVGRTITPNSVQAAYRLNHVRDYTLLNDPDLNNTTDVIFASGWKATNAALAEVVK